MVFQDQIPSSNTRSAVPLHLPLLVPLEVWQHRINFTVQSKPTAHRSQFSQIPKPSTDHGELMPQQPPAARRPSQSTPPSSKRWGRPRMYSSISPSLRSEPAPMV